MKFTKKQVNEAFVKLPEPIQDLILDQSTMAQKQKIANEHGLHIDQLGELDVAINAVKVGLITPTEFVPEVQTVLGVSPEKAALIAHAIDGQILRPLQDQIKLYTATAGKVEGLGDKQSDDILNKERVLNEIENPAPASPIIKPTEQVVPPLKAPDPYAEKLSGSFSVPRQESRISDPYREPIE